MLLPVQNRIEVEPEVPEAWYLFQLNVPSSNTQFSIQPGQTLVCTEKHCFWVFCIQCEFVGIEPGTDAPDLSCLTDSP